MNQQKVNDELKKNYNKYYELFSNINEACLYVECLFDDDNNIYDALILEVNKMFLEISGYNEGEVNNKKLSEALPFIDQEHYKWMINFCEQSLSSEQHTESESFFPYFNKWFYVHSYKFNDKHLWVLLRDTTEHKRHIEELKTKHIEITKKPDDNLLKDTDYFHKIIDLPLFKNIQSVFASSFKCFSVITNTDNQPITKLQDYSNLYSIIYQTDKGKSLIDKLKDELKKIINEKDMYLIKSDELNLIMGGIPFLINDKHISNWLFGFFFSNQSNEDSANKIASNIGIRTGIIKEKLPNSSETEIINNIENYQQIIKLINDMVSTIFVNKVRLINETKNKEEHEKLFRLNEKRIKALFSLTLMNESSSEEIENFILKNGIELTESESGFIGFVDKYNKVIRIYNQIEDINLSKKTNKKATKIQIKDSDIWENIIKNKKPYIINNIDKKEIDIKRIMVIPTTEDGNIGLIVAVKNKKTDYTAADLQQLHLMVRSMWVILKLRRIEEQIKISQNEGVILLKEVHHRVKNNFQIIKSLLNLQLSSITDEKILDVFNDVQKRIKAMSIIYEILSKSKDMSNIFVYKYVNRLYNFLLSYYKSTDMNIDTEINIDKEIEINIDIAIPFGLIINEIVSNSLYHAFPKEKKGKIQINLNKNYNKYTLEIKDDGIGMDKNIDIKSTKSLGLRLIRILVSQLSGNIQLDRNDGTRYKIVFKV